MTERLVDLTVLFFLGVIMPAQLFILLVVSIVILDTILALFTISKRNQVFSWKKLFGKWVFKVMIYQLIILTFFWFDKILLSELTMKLFGFDDLGIKLITFVLLRAEVLSIKKHFDLYFGRRLSDDAEQSYTFMMSIKNKLRDLLD